VREIRTLKAKHCRNKSITREEASAELAEAADDMVFRIRKEFKGRILRRTAASKKWDGKKLLDLPPARECGGFITLCETELKALEKMHGKAVE
jgi:hypothetical protein